MSPVTHLLASWVVAEDAVQDRRTSPLSLMSARLDAVVVRALQARFGHP